MSSSMTRPASLPAGFEIGRYVVERRLARGGMAELYLVKARGPFGFNKQCVLKVGLPHLAEDQRYSTMFVHEARIASRLEHPNIAQILDVGTFEGGPYMAMQYVAGHDVRQLMKALGGVPIDLPVALRIASRVAAGLAYAHAQTDEHGQPLSIVHRDVTPANVMVSFDGDVKLVDFGVAKSTVQDEATRDGVIKGKAAYLSPEQARGRTIDHRTDLFALGILLFEMTTGRRLFRGDSDFEMLRMIVDGDHPRPEDVRDEYPPELSAIVMKALSVDVEQRYQSAGALRDDLEAFARRFDLHATEVDIANLMKTLFHAPDDAMEQLATNPIRPMGLESALVSVGAATGMHAEGPAAPETQIAMSPSESGGETFVAASGSAPQVAIASHEGRHERSEVARA